MAASRAPGLSHCSTVRVCPRLAFARDRGREADGIALARELAMTGYRTAEDFGHDLLSTLSLPSREITA